MRVAAGAHRGGDARGPGAAARRAEGELLVASGDAAVALAGAAPRREIVARPRDAVAWALYYPPMLAPLAERRGRAGALPPGLQRALERVAANDYAGAIAALDAVPAAARDARYYTYRAGVLLNVGRVDEAEAALARALALEPAAAEALAQRAVLAGRAEPARGGAGGRQAGGRAEPGFGAGADRAVLRAAGGLRARGGARGAARGGRAQPGRCAGLGAPRRARAVVRRAARRAGRGRAGGGAGARPRPHADGAGLRRADPDRHRSRPRRRSSARSSSTPPSRSPASASGLAKIRAGDLEAGRRELEIAAALDPNNSLLRSYLGKAYFEERRGPLDAEQFQIAKELDPNDPTPWFYDAIRLQTENRPVEALRDLETSIALNDNRALYRSRLLLDEDRAARGVSLARIYDDLGFEQVGAGRGDQVAEPRPGQLVGAPLPLRHLRPPAAPRDRPRQRAAAGAAAAADQHQSGPAEPADHRSQCRRRRRSGRGRLQRVHAAVRAQPGAADRHGRR